jgi:hypothetical protein
MPFALKLANTGTADPAQPGPAEDARRKLAAAIENAAAAQQLVADNDLQVSALGAQNPSAIPAPTMSRRAARDALEDAQETIATIKAARDLAQSEGRRLKSSAASAEFRVELVAAEAIAADPSVRRVCERFLAVQREFVNIRSVLSFLQAKSALPPEYSKILWDRDLVGDRAASWRQTFEAMRQDANALLPGE